MSRAESMRLVKKLLKQGFEVERTGSGHWKVTRPGTQESTIIAFSPGTSSMHKTRKRLRDMGYKE